MCSDRRKNHRCGQKKQKAPALLYLASGPLPNAATLSVVPTEFAAEPTTRMNSSKFRNLNFSPSIKKTTEYSFELFLSIYRYLKFFLKFLTSLLSNWIVLLNKRSLKKILFSKATVVMRFPAKKNAGCPKAPRDFPPRKDGILHFPSGCLRTPLPLPQSLYGQPYADVTTKTKLQPNFHSNGASQGAARAGSAPIHTLYLFWIPEINSTVTAANE